MIEILTDTTMVDTHTGTKHKQSGVVTVATSAL